MATGMPSDLDAERAVLGHVGDSDAGSHRTSLMRSAPLPLPASSRLDRRADPLPQLGHPDLVDQLAEEAADHQPAGLGPGMPRAIR